MIWVYHNCHSKIGRHHIVFAFLAVLSLQLTATNISAQTNANSTGNTNQSTPSPTAEPTPIPISAIATEAEVVNGRLRSIRTILDERSDIREITDQLPQMTQQVDVEESGALTILAGSPTLDEIRAVESEWQAITRRFTSWKRMLQTRIATVDKSIADLNQLSQTWRLTLSSTGAVPSSEASTENVDEAIPPEVLAKLNETIAAIDEARRQALERRSALLAVQSRVSELESRANAVDDEIKKVRGRALTNLFVRDEPPIWALQEKSISFRTLTDDAIGSLSEQRAELQTYAAGRTERFLLHGLIFILITAGLYWAGRRVQPFVAKEPKLEKAAQVFSLPIATGLILSILLSGWMYPQAPRLLTSLIGAAALVPVVLLLRRMVERPLFIILNALVVLYFIDRFRDLLVSQPLTARFVFLVEMLGAILFSIWFLKSKRLSGGVQAAHYHIFEIIRKVVPFVLAVFIFAFASNLLGFVSLANLIGNGVLGSAYLALVIYTAVQIIRGLIIFALRVRPLSGTLIVKNNRPLIRDRTVRLVRWAAVIVWVLLTLNLFSIREPIYNFLHGWLSWSATVGSVSFSIGSVVLFVVMIWIAVLISRFVRFVLEEDVYPRVDVAGGVSYAVSTMLHYSILVVGFLIAVGVLGVDFTKFALIAGAVGIGIGFGLQNVVNNFVSGLILLFERPVKVGDTVQINEHIGSLKHIGLRASILRKVDGSDVIVPNSQLISDAVINWTMSDEKRRIDIPVGVAYGTDPTLVTELLTAITDKYDTVMKDPSPKTLFLGLGDSSLDFELRFWTDQTEGWVGLRSDVLTEVYRVLDEAGIEIPFPQRDLNIRNIDDAAADKLSRPSPDTSEPPS